MTNRALAITAAVPAIKPKPITPAMMKRQLSLNLGAQVKWFWNRVVSQPSQRWQLRRQRPATRSSCSGRSGENPREAGADRVGGTDAADD